jgi:hypothetical protein
VRITAQTKHASFNNARPGVNTFPTEGGNASRARTARMPTISVPITPTRREQKSNTLHPQRTPRVPTKARLTDGTINDRPIGDEVG